MNTDTSEPQADAPKNRTAKSVLFSIFIGIWLIGLALVVRSGWQVPTYMLIVASIFFFMLVPSMVELVQDYDRFAARFGSGSDDASAANGQKD